MDFLSAFGVGFRATHDAHIPAPPVLSAPTTEAMVLCVLQVGFTPSRVFASGPKAAHALISIAAMVYLLVIQPAQLRARSISEGVLTPQQIFAAIFAGSGLDDEDFSSCPPEPPRTHAMRSSRWACRAFGAHSRHCCTVRVLLQVGAHHRRHPSPHLAQVLWARGRRAAGMCMACSNMHSMHVVCAFASS